jgi:Na+/melibiose symporter-like transporter
MKMRLPLTGRAQKIVYSTGNIGYTGFFQLVGAFLIFFLVDVVRLDAWLAGLAYAISFGFWNALNDPIIGILSDKTRSRIGRRRPWIIIGVPATLILFFLIWAPPIGGTPLEEPRNMGIFLFATGILFLWSWAYSMVAIPWYALFPQMWRSVKDRTEVTIWLQAFGVIGGAVAIMIFPIIIIAFSTTSLGITTLEIPDGMVGVPYTEDLQAADGTEPYTWSLDNASTLPDGLQLDSGGSLSGTPESAGEYTFIVGVTDTESSTSSQEVNVYIREEGAPLSIATRSLSEGREGEEYEAVLEALGGEPPYSWTCVVKEDECLPYGVEIDNETGTISGEPTDEADYKFTIMVTDSATPPNEASRQLSIDIASEHEKGSFSGWIWAGLTVGIVFSIAFFVSLLGVTEPKELELDRSWSVARSLKTTLLNRIFLIFTVINVMTWCMFGWLTAMLPFFAKHCLGLGLDELPLLFAPTMIAMFIFFPFWRKIYISRGPKFTLAAASIAVIVTFIPCLVVQGAWQGALWAFFVGAAVGGILLARGVMTADLPDADEAETGARREGAYYGAIKAGEKLAFVLVGVSSSIVLGTLIGYVAGEPKPEFMNMGIRIGMVGFTALYMAILLIFLRIYPLGKERIDEISTKIQALRTAKGEDEESTVDGSR